MRWDETVASGCRYGKVAGAIWGDHEILWEESEDYYQGHATFLARSPAGNFSFYEWSYGSCSGCDDWEARRLSNEEIAQEMRTTAIWFTDESHLINWLRMIQQNDPEEYKVGTLRALGLAQIIDLFGGCARMRLKRMAEKVLPMLLGDENGRKILPKM